MLSKNIQNISKQIPQVSSDPSINLALHTISIGKQALAFVNTKRSSEKLAEEISKKIKNLSEEKNLNKLSEQALKALSRPTKQCERLAFCLKKGIAFHHAGLASKQKELVEDNFRNGAIKIICCTPSLAYGLDLPAYRVIIRDLKRYGHRGLDWIPVLEYLQQSGRAGRPKYDKIGESIIVAKSKPEKETVTEKYIQGQPEDIYSKLAVEPVLRTYMLSLISANMVNSKKTLLEFFGKTFWAFQFRDMNALESIIMKMLKLLEDWEFIITSSSAAKKESSNNGFVSADEFQNVEDKSEETGRIRATILGKRIAELYIDPLTANFFIECLRNATRRTAGQSELKPFPLLQVICHTLEMRPLLTLRTRDYDKVEEFLNTYINEMLENEPSAFDHDYEAYLQSVKTAMFMHDWIDEKDEEYLLETYNIRPGELRAKLDRADWLLYATEEIVRILQFQALRKDIVKIKIMLKHGAREELLPLIKLKNVGRVRARKLYNNRIHTIADVKKADLMKLAQLLGMEIALKIKKQVDQDFDAMKVKDNKRKGQISLGDY